MSEIRHTCCERVQKNYLFYLCGKTAKHERDNKWYCGMHDPIAVAAKHAKRKEAHDENLRAFYKAQEEKKETQRRADLYPELLEAFKTTRAVLQSINDMGEKSPITDTLWMPSGHETLFDFIDAAIAKAEGKA